MFLEIPFCPTDVFCFGIFFFFLIVVAVAFDVKHISGVVRDRCVIVLMSSCCGGAPCTLFTLFLSAHSRSITEEEVARLVVGHDSGTYRACFAGDDTPRACPVPVNNDSGTRRILKREVTRAGNCWYKN